MPINHSAASETASLVADLARDLHDALTKARVDPGVAEIADRLAIAARDLQLHHDTATAPSFVSMAFQRDAWVSLAIVGDKALRGKINDPVYDTPGYMVDRASATIEQIAKALNIELDRPTDLV